MKPHCRSLGKTSASKDCLTDMELFNLERAQQTAEMWEWIMIIGVFIGFLIVGIFCGHCMRGSQSPETTDQPTDSSQINRGSNLARNQVR
ncbi:Oidioi.mRNA.OKI2018_I69.chr1.g598.t1.cds [Oikopleura dioica]|uniref:Oidioi.mRNA.OKI2018_I69.chr1.g598.t1.cds n=1 Tax=Oikopleura dioica TaxID=34765 RepID=A0ABN7SUK5_OIKDI|nr:Oidioi.mRNA.OKI2018_I69.chr1.g598.t1.cds [Oikopleura dioica]